MILNINRWHVAAALLYSLGLFLMPSNWLIGHFMTHKSKMAVGGAMIFIAAPLFALKREEDQEVTVAPPAPIPTPPSTPYHRFAEQEYSIALHDVRRMIETMRADDRLVAHVFRRLAKAIAEVHEAPELARYANGAADLADALGDEGPPNA